MDYMNLPVENRNHLSEQAKAIRERIIQHTKDLVETGKMLVEVKHGLDVKHGQWTHWVERELKMPMRTVQVWMQAAQFVLAHPDKNAKLALLQPTSLMRLGAKSCPPEAQDEVFNRLKSSKPLSDGEVAKIIKAHQPQKFVPDIPKPVHVTQPIVPEPLHSQLFDRIVRAVREGDDVDLWGELREALPAVVFGASETYAWPDEARELVHTIN